MMSTSYRSIILQLEEASRQAIENGPKGIRKELVHELDHAKGHLEKAMQIIAEYNNADWVGYRVKP